MPLTLLEPLGDRLTLPAAPYAVGSGQGMLAGSLFAVAERPAAAGAQVTVKVLGVYRLDAVAGDSFAAGAPVYWDNTARLCTSTVSGNRLIGVAVAPKATGAPRVDVRLDGVTR